MRDYPLIEVLRANDATAMEQRMAAETIEQLHAELTRMKIVESGSIEEIAHANKTIEQLHGCISNVMTEEQLACHPPNLDGLSIREYLTPPKDK